MHLRPSLLLATAVLPLGACRDARGPTESPPPPWSSEMPPPPGSSCHEWARVCAVAIPTYDGSGQVVHPDLALIPDTWNAHAYWLAITPYRDGNPGYENPSLVVDGSGPRWAVPDGGVNPIVPQPVDGHYSDPDVVFAPDRRQLRYYFRRTARGRDDILLTTSDDGVTWSAPRVVVSAPGIAIVSPAVVRESDRGWTMWSVNAVAGGCQARSTTVERRTSSDGVHWSSATSVSLAQDGYVVWHLDVQRVPSRGEYWAVYAAYPVGSGCAANDLFLARSEDGITWHTYPSPILARGEFAPFRETVYRSTFTYEAETDAIRLWLTGATFTGSAWVWTAATVRWQVPQLLAHVAALNVALRPAVERAAEAPVVWNPNGGASATDFP